MAFRTEAYLTKSAMTLAALAMALGPACVGPAGVASEAESSSTGPSAPESSGSEGTVLPLCLDPQPLDFGDADWAKAPYEPPGDMGKPSDPDDPGSDSGAGFIQDPDGGGVALECDGWAQDCPRGEKCMPWANDGGVDWNAMRCSPLDPDPSTVGEPCRVEGSAVSGIDDCDISSMCWEPNEELEGSCIAFCSGNEANPVCAPGTWCFSGYEGTINVCLDEALCGADEVCRCMCPADPDCEGGEHEFCVPAVDEAELIDQLGPKIPVVFEEPTSCPETTDPLVVYMSNDDSNSQASPALARRSIYDGQLVPPSRVRIHEFLNYYEIGDEAPSDKGARVALQMRRTDVDLGEFTMAVQAIGRGMTDEDRPPLNLVFSLDTSGSMSGERLELLKATARAAAGKLRAGDVVSMVTWSSDQVVPLEGHEVAGPDDPVVLAAIEAAAATGSTDLESGLVRAYQLAADHRFAGGINRVVLISDGGANAGVTDIDLIASQANDGDDEGTYLVGVGVGDAAGYRDTLMDAVTDAGKGAYVFIDSVEEAERQFDGRFLANLAVAARDVKFQLTLPWYFGIKKFHGEEYSPNPAEVESQHLSANDTMTFHQIIAACDPSHIVTCDEIKARVDYTDPLTGLEAHDEVVTTVGQIVVEDSAALRKADLVVGYAKALIVIGTLAAQNQPEQAKAVALSMAGWAQQTQAALGGDADAGEIAELMAMYAEQF